jgi:short subunit dehydrogenase-like uncharacterized protein
VVDIGVPGSLDRAVLGRTIACACAGPFADVGEPILAACARGGVHYVDTTGEQSFVARALNGYDAAAKASGACIVPAMGYEIAPADWAANIVAARLDGTPDEIIIVYALRDDEGRPFATSQGTKRSALGIVASGDGGQWVNGALVAERLGGVVHAFEWSRGESAVGVSFPRPNANVTPSHTGARTVRTFLEVSPSMARALHAAHNVAPRLARLVRPLLNCAIARSAESPDQTLRQRARYRVFTTASIRACGRPS